jgi:hypothetical protein
MDRYSTPLAPELADFAEVSSAQIVLDVGCGQGHLGELVEEAGGLRDVEEGVLTVHVEHSTFEDSWERSCSASGRPALTSPHSLPRERRPAGALSAAARCPFVLEARASGRTRPR